MIEQFFIPSPLGWLEISFKEDKLYSLSLADKRDLSANKNDRQLSRFIHSQSLEIIQKKKPSPLARHCQKQLENYFKGKLTKLNMPLFDRGTDFQKRVWQSLKQIPWGQTKTYGQIAGKLQKRKGARAVGNCCAKNPRLFFTPCHRVLSQKGLGGFALGLKAKKYLLSLEGINF